MQLLPLNRIGNHLRDCHCLCASVFLVTAHASKESKVPQTPTQGGCFVWDWFVFVLANSLV